MTTQNSFLTAKDIKVYLEIGNDKLYDFVLNSKKIKKCKFANKYYIDIESFLYFLKGTKNIDFSKFYKEETLPKYVNVKKFAEMYDISTNTAYKYVKIKTFPATKIGQKYYIWIDLIPLWLTKKKK